ncbi:MAG: hypothetical protein GY870_20350 [archaeon]|nr:hypothetical protein [archaeon]
MADVEFRKQVIDLVFSDKIKYCYQCSRCTDECPVAKAVPDRYNPRANIMLAFLGLKDMIMGSDGFNIWGCQICDTCDEVCPQKIPLTEVFSLLKNMSVSAGTAPEYYTGQAKMIFENGKAIPMQDAIARRRDKMGIPIVQAPDVNEIQTILRETGFDKKIGG